jgi:selenocysteine-specific translation elongation factor
MIMGIIDIFKNKTDFLGNNYDNDDQTSEKSENYYDFSMLSSVNAENSSFKFVVDGLLMKASQGIVVSGKCELGEVNVGDAVVYIRTNGERMYSIVENIESLGDIVGNHLLSNILALTLSNIDESIVEEGDIVVK